MPMYKVELKNLPLKGYRIDDYGSKVFNKLKSDKVFPFNKFKVEKNLIEKENQTNENQYHAFLRGLNESYNFSEFFNWQNYDIHKQSSLRRKLQQKSYENRLVFASAYIFNMQNSGEDIEKLNSKNNEIYIKTQNSKTTFISESNEDARKLLVEISKIPEYFREVERF